MGRKFHMPLPVAVFRSCIGDIETWRLFAMAIISSNISTIEKEKYVSMHTILLQILRYHMLDDKFVLTHMNIFVYRCLSNHPV